MATDAELDAAGDAAHEAVYNLHKLAKKRKPPAGRPIVIPRVVKGKRRVRDWGMVNCFYADGAPVCDFALCDVAGPTYASRQRPPMTMDRAMLGLRLKSLAGLNTIRMTASLEQKRDAYFGRGDYAIPVPMNRWDRWGSLLSLCRQWKAAGGAVEMELGNDRMRSYNDFGSGAEAVAKLRERVKVFVGAFLAVVDTWIPCREISEEWSGQEVRLVNMLRALGCDHIGMHNGQGDTGLYGADVLYYQGVDMDNDMPLSKIFELIDDQLPDVMVEVGHQGGKVDADELHHTGILYDGSEVTADGYRAYQPWSSAGVAEPHLRCGEIYGHVAARYPAVVGLGASPLGVVVGQ